MTFPASRQQWNDAKNPDTSPMIRPHYTSPLKRRLTSELRHALPPLMLLGDESSSSILSVSSSSSSLSTPLERRKRTLSFRKQLKIAEEPLRRMLEEKQQQIQQPQKQKQETSSDQSSSCSEHAPSTCPETTEKVDSPRSLTLYAPRMNKTIATGLHFL